MSRRILLTTAFVSLLGAACWISRPGAASAQQPPLASIARSEQQDATEQWWLVSTVLRTVQDAASFGRPVTAAPEPLVMARDAWQRSTDRTPTQYSALIGNRRLAATVSLTRHIWDPDAYTAVAAEMLGPSPADHVGSSPTILAALRDARPDALHEVNEQVSASLAEHFRSPALHQQAALLLGAFALRESSSWFTDHRAILCRMAAHLAVARALDSRPSAKTIDGRVAEVILLAIAGRQTDALAALEAAKPQLKALDQDAWIRTLQLRITDDWRIPVAATAPLLERLEYYRAIRERTSIPKALTVLDTIEEEPLAEWGRITGMTGLDVESGHHFIPGGLDLELTDATAAWRRFNEGDPSPRQLVADLNVPLAPGPVAGSRVRSRFSVIDWSLWAAFYQRNLCAWLVMANRHHWNLGLPEDVKTWNAHSDEMFDTLKLYPLVLRFRASNREEYEAAVRRSVPLIMQSPELVTDIGWRSLINGRPFDAPLQKLPPEQAWFDPMMPLGTTYEITFRAWGLNGLWTLRREDVATLRAVAPYNYELVWEALCQKYGEPIPRPPAVAAIRELDAIWQYDLEAMHALMLMLDQHPDDFLPIAERACDVEAGQCERLADYLFDLGREADAARAYERMIAGARDRVGVSNSVDWLVRYYHDTGQRERAMEIAKMAAEVYSAGGLTALADELDRLGRREHAEEVYKTIASRYGSDISLLTFYLREARRAGTPLDNARTHELIREHFGVRGMMPMSSAPNEPPADGVHVASLGLSARRLGLALEDVVVALDGWRVHNTDQYEIVKWITETDDMHLLVWRDGKYVEVRAKVPRRTWQVRILDYVPPAPATR